MVLVLLYLLSATLAVEAVVSGIGIAYADLAFQVPVLVEYPCITIANTRTDEPALIAAVGELREISTQEFNVVLQVTDVVLTSVGMETQEVTSETVAEPVARFWLYHPMFPLTVVRHGPTIEVAR